MGTRKVFRSVLAGMLCISVGGVDIAFSQNIEEPYEVGTWANFCDAAISHTFDDGTGNQFSIAMPMFDEKGYHMTFATVTSGGMFPGWDQLGAAFEKGHEIASHSVTHPQTVNDDEMKRSHDAIVENVPGELCVSMIYPNCNVPNESDVRKYYIAGRVCGGGPEGSTPGNILRVASQIVGQSGGYTDLDGYANQAVGNNGWAVYLHHGVDGDHSWAYTSSSDLQSHLDFLDNNREKFWVETFGNVSRYIKERDAASVMEKSSGDNSFTIEVTDDLDDEIFNFPLTLRRPLPDGWNEDEVNVKQGEAEMACAVVTDGSDKLIQFEAVPDGGNVVIASGVTSVRHGHPDGAAPESGIVWLLKDELVFESDAGEMSVRLYGLSGRLLARYSIDGNSGVSRIPLTDEITRSAFIVKVDGNGMSYMEKVVPRF